MKKLFLILLLLSICSVGECGVTFDKVDDIINCGSSDSLDTAFTPGNPISISLEINLVSTGEGTGGYLVAKGDSTDGYYWIFRVLPTNAIQIYINCTGVNQFIRTSNNNSFSLSTPTNIIFTHDGSLTAANSHIYVNNSEVSYATTQNGQTALRNVNAYNCLIGNSTGLDRTTDGDINDVKIYARVLTQAERSQIYNSKLKNRDIISATSLSGYWPMDDQEAGTSADGDTVRDLSGNGNNGTGDNGANGTGLQWVGESILSYIPGVIYQ